jgi:hypothetical protein
LGEGEQHGTYEISDRLTGHQMYLGGQMDQHHLRKEDDMRNRKEKNDVKITYFQRSWEWKLNSLQKLRKQ